MSAQTRPASDSSSTENASVANAAAPEMPSPVAKIAAKSVSRPKAKQSLTALLRKWHQRIGLTAAVFLIWLGSSGAILSRSDQFGFDAMRLHWDWLTAWYGLSAESPRMGFEAAGHWMAATKESTLLDAREVEPRIPPPIGFVTLDGASGKQLVIGTADSLVIVAPDGSRVDELRAPILPVSALRRIGISADGGIAVVAGREAAEPGGGVGDGFAGAGLAVAADGEGVGARGGGVTEHGEQVGLAEVARSALIACTGTCLSVHILVGGYGGLGDLETGIGSSGETLIQVGVVDRLLQSAALGFFIRSGSEAAVHEFRHGEERSPQADLLDDFLGQGLQLRVGVFARAEPVGVLGIGTVGLGLTDGKAETADPRFMLHALGVW